MPLKSLEILLTYFQCLCPQLNRKWLTKPTVLQMSGCVHNIAYIKLPIALEYGTLFIKFFLLWTLGHVSRHKFSPLATGVSISLQSYVVNRLRIFSMYDSWDKAIKFLEWSLWILTPTMYSSSFMSFISKLRDNQLFIAYTKIRLFLANNISSI